jgi:hypothetical protein
LITITLIARVQKDLIFRLVYPPLKLINHIRLGAVFVGLRIICHRRSSQERIHKKQIVLFGKAEQR